MEKIALFGILTRISPAGHEKAVKPCRTGLFPGSEGENFPVFVENPVESVSNSGVKLGENRKSSEKTLKNWAFFRVERVEYFFH